MARGAAQEEALLNQQAGTQFQNAQNLYGTVTGADKAILANPGFTPAQVGTQMNAAMTPIAGANAAAEERMVRRANATGNSAGLVSGEDELARSAARTGSEAAYGVQAGADKVALEDRNAALNRESGLYGPTTSSANNLYATATEAMKARPSIAQNVLDYANAFKAFGQGSQAFRGLYGGSGSGGGGGGIYG